ncbi:hypothetical protein MYAM1_002967 [Malassezia yamatoensis]|uniref:Uncharacterized protein n=1 Tax=Malassezia yamatoensis TaxID=253288 RepID=A0AAJ5YT39_9BASI|nr:hypothetical protein MYAM1_002967 [Malassezia yamatoensis]
MPVTPGRITPWSTPPKSALPVISSENKSDHNGKRTANVENMNKVLSASNSSPSTLQNYNKAQPEAPQSASANPYTSSLSQPSKTPSNNPSKVPIYSRNTPMTPATAQRRMAWNLSALGALYGLPMLWPGSIDIYYMTLEKLVTLSSLPAESDELIDSVLFWLKYALTLVFALNIIEALTVRRSSAKIEPGPTEVGVALARSTSNGSPLTRADIRLRRQPSGVQSPVTPVSPQSRVTSCSSPSLRIADSPSNRRFSAKPFGIGQGRPTTPFSKRIPSQTPDRRTPSYHDVYSVRKVSRSPSVFSASQALRGDQGTLSMSRGLLADDAYEVEKALQQLR